MGALVGELEGKRVLAVSTEAGSGKAILPVLGALVVRGVMVQAYLPSDVLALGKQFPELTPRGVHLAAAEELPAEEIGPDAGPHAVLVGTTAAKSPERQLTLESRAGGIRTVGVVDERYGFRRRFAGEGNDLTYLPDAVSVMDGECLATAVAEGLPGSRLHVTGSPILSYLAFGLGSSWRESDGPLYRSDPSWKQVTFLSETFAQDNGSTPGARGRLGGFLGFTEDTVRADVVRALQDIGMPTALIEKLHPSDTAEPKEARVGDALHWKQMRQVQLWPLLMQSDAVIGMRSMALLEAALLGCRVASYQPNLIGENLCGAVRFGLAAELGTPQDLKGWLLKSLSAESGRVSPPIDLPFIRPDAAERVADLVLGMPGYR